MPRTARASVGGTAYHVINRGNARSTVFFDPDDFAFFAGLIERACKRVAIRVLAYCLMPNHVHFVLWPSGDRDLSTWMQWLLTAHVRRHHQRYGTDGRIWQGRFKAFPIEQDEHLLTVMRYVERNPVRAGLVARAENWPWSSSALLRSSPRPRWLIEPPVPRPSNWLHWVNTPQTDDELQGLRRSVNRGTPWGSKPWTSAAAKALGLESTLRSPGRPKRLHKERALGEQT